MILQALCQLADRENLIADPDFECKPVSWRVTLAADGAKATVEDLRHDVNAGTKRKPKYEGKPVLVPRQPIRTSGDSAFFLVDKAEYVFGLDPAGKRQVEKLRQRASLFREQVEQCAAGSGDAAVAVVAKYLTTLASNPDTAKDLLAACDVSANDLFAFRVWPDEDFVHRHAAVVAYWKGRREETRPPADASLRCLVTGEPMAETGLFPLIKKLPGGTSSGVALVSHNAPAFESYGLRGNQNAPISRAAAEQAATALNRLLHPACPNPREPGTTLPKRFVRLTGDTVVSYWAAGGEEMLNAIAALFEAESEDSVAAAYRGIWSGRPVQLDDPTAFYAMTLTGTQGRAIVRDWFESTVGEVASCLAQHFADFRIVWNARPKKGNPPPPAIRLDRLVESLSAEGRADAAPGSLEAALVRSALTGIPYPLQLLQRALVRARVEAGRDSWIDAARRDARAAILKAVFNRRRRFDSQAATRYPEVNTHMNPNSDSPGYALGLLMAVLERLQEAALGDVNTSIVDRYFSAASATPRMIFVRLLKNAQHHARKARDSDDKRDRATAFRCERIVDWVASRFDVDRKAYPPRSNGMPAHLDLEQQGLFVLGYHQMRHWLWMTKEERDAWERTNADAPRVFRWLKQSDDVPGPEPALA